MGREWTGKVVEFVVDNQAVVAVLQSGYGKEEHLMHLLRVLVWLASHFQFWFLASHMWHSRRKSTFRRNNTKMSYLYHVVALSLLYLLVLVALQSVLLFPSYKGKQVDL